MALILEQTFPLGRYHATRWNQNPFEDRFGEWPPSPWRLLRALAARWFQYSRETGDENAELRDRLLQTIAGCVPTYCVPELRWRGTPVRQYQPTKVAWTDPSKKAAAYKKSKTTMVIDQYRALPDTVPLYWVFELRDGVLGESEYALLGRLVERTLYFGRAESHCRLRLVAELPAGYSVNCTLSASKRDGNPPVLVADPATRLDVATLLAATADKLLAGRSIPPGTKWYYAHLPSPPRLSPIQAPERQYPTNLRVIQFAVGGRVFPTSDRWIKIAERFRGRVLKTCARQILGDQEAEYRDLQPHQRAELALLSGKDGAARPLDGHQHAYFIVWPDANGDPTRLVVFRQTPFEQHEIESLLQASERPYPWEAGNPEWRVRLVLLPFSTAPPCGLVGEDAHRVWKSVTPFVPPAKRHRFRENGRERRGEFPDQILRKLLVKQGFPVPQRIEALDDDTPAAPQTLGDWASIHEWVYIHETHSERRHRRAERGRAVRPGFRFRITFLEPVCGPVCVGHSSHFGLGLFEPAKDDASSEGPS